MFHSTMDVVLQHEGCTNGRLQNKIEVLKPLRIDDSIKTKKDGVHNLMQSLFYPGVPNN